MEITEQYLDMNTRYLSIWLMILALLCVRFLWSRAQGRPVFVTCEQATDAESRLACGQRIWLSKTDLYELELVPGFSERLAGQILMKREEITQKAKLLGKDNESKAFEVVKGIGAKKAHALGEYVDSTK